MVYTASWKLLSALVLEEADEDGEEAKGKIKAPHSWRFAAGEAWHLLLL